MMFYSSRLLILLALFCINSRSCLCQELRYALFTSGPTGSFDSSGAVPAIELAEEMINADSSILPGYNLTHTPVVDTMCDRTVSLNEYFDTISPPNPTVLGLLGCGCSVASTPVAEIIQHNSVSQVSYASSSIELSDRRRFPNFFRTYPSDADFAPAVVTLIQQYGWRRIAFITQDESLFTEAVNLLQEPLSVVGIGMVNRIVSSNFSGRPLDTDFFFEENDYRVFFLNTFSNIGRKILCEAYSKGFMHPRYVWLTYGWYQDRWWTEEVNPEPTNCTDHQLAEALHRSLALQLIPDLNELNATTDTGLTPGQFDFLYQARINFTPANNYTSVFLANMAYDALWTFALALNRTNGMLQNSNRPVLASLTGCNVPGELVSLENFDYSNQFMGCVIRWNLERTDFVGVSGRVEFDSTGSRSFERVDFFQYRGLDMSSGLYKALFASAQTINKSSTIFVYESGENNTTVFPEGIPPDGIAIPQIFTFHLALVIPYYIFATAGLVFCTVCLVFNFTQRNKKVVRITSPNINYFIIVGAYIMYLSIYFRILPSTEFSLNVTRCFSDYLASTTGYSLAFSAILVKMGRVYYIFHNPSLHKKKLKDWKLFLMALGISSVGITLSVLQVAVPQFRPIPFLANSTEAINPISDEFDVSIQQQVYVCFSIGRNIYATVWVGLTVIYTGLMQIIALILAFQTRKVKIKQLHDSKYIAAMVHTSGVALVVNTIAIVIDATFLNVVEILFSGSLLAATTIFLGLAFIPTMVSLYRDPTGDFTLTEVGAGSEAGISRSINRTETERKHSQMELRIIELEEAVQTYETSNSSQPVNGRSSASLPGKAMPTVSTRNCAS